jgi:uncharacterized repeat protein (TIGR01451 family)
MNRLHSTSSHRVARRRTPAAYGIILLVSAVAFLLLTVALLPAPAEAAARFCPPEPPPEPSVARPRALTDGKDLNGGDLTPGDEILWTITVKNIGAITLTEILVTNVIPEWTSYVDGSIEGTGADDSAGTALTWAVGTLKCGERLTLSFRSRIDDSAPVGTLIVNQASTDSAETPASASKEVSMQVVVESTGTSSVVGSASSSTTVPEVAADEGGSTETADAAEAASAGAVASSETTTPSSPATTLLEVAAVEVPGPVAAATGDDSTGYKLGLGLGVGLGGLAVIGLATGLLMRRRKKAAAA